MNNLLIKSELIAETIAILREGGARNCETVVLWLGSANRITEVYRPEQIVDIDFFHLPNSSLRNLMSHLRATRQRVLAQVHSHPGEAFHSKADDNWAIIRHEGALSLVLPTFAMCATTDTFYDDAVTYQLDAADRWERTDTRTKLVIGA